jgi:hypothetical protein
MGHSDTGDVNREKLPSRFGAGLEAVEFALLKIYFYEIQRSENRTALLMMV